MQPAEDYRTARGSRSQAAANAVITAFCRCSPFYRRMEGCVLDAPISTVGVPDVSAMAKNQGRSAGGINYTKRECDAMFLARGCWIIVTGYVLRSLTILFFSPVPLGAATSAYTSLAYNGRMWQVRQKHPVRRLNQFRYRGRRATCSRWLETKSGRARRARPCHRRTKET